VDMFEVLTNSGLGYIGVHTTDDKVARSSIGYLCTNVAWKVKLAFAPRNVNLKSSNVS
jgi:hypothetical protein